MVIPLLLLIELLKLTDHKCDHNAGGRILVYGTYESQKRLLLSPKANN